MNLDSRIEKIDDIYNPFDLEKENFADYIGQKVYAANCLTAFSNLRNAVYGTLEIVVLIKDKPFVVDGENYIFFIPESVLKEEEVQWECNLAFQKTLNYSQYTALKNDIKEFCEKISKLMSYTTVDTFLTVDTSFKVEFESIKSYQVDQYGKNICKAEFGRIAISKHNSGKVKYTIYAYKLENGLYRYGVPYSNTGINPYSNIVDALTDYMFKEKISLYWGKYGLFKS